MRRMFVASVVAGAVLAATACAAPRQTLGTRNNACFRSLPTANAAVRDNGRLVGVRRVSRVTLLKSFPTAQVPAAREFCVVAFSDDYRNDKVDHPAGEPIGKYALVIVDMRGTTAHQTFLVDRLPFHLRHR
jgi:hypothetical protein